MAGLEKANEPQPRCPVCINNEGVQVQCHYTGDLSTNGKKNLFNSQRPEHKSR